MRPARPALAAALLGLSVAAACIPGAMPPRVPARGTLSLDDAPRPAPAATGPLAVVFAAPRGETTSEAEIGIVFNKPMRALGLGPSDPPPPISIRPAARGAFHWIGSSSLRFDAAEPLAPATAYNVEIPAGTRALDGTELAEPFVLAMTTPRAAVVESEPADGARDVEPKTPIKLRFNLPVTDAEITRAVTIQAGKARAPIAFSIARHGPRDVELTPAKPLPLADRIQVRVDGSLRAERGELPAGKDREIAFSTVMPPAVVAWKCDPPPDDATACDPEGWPVLELSGEVSRAALARAVTFDPPVAWDRTALLHDDYPSNQIEIQAEFKPGTTYRARLAPDPKLVDAWGQRLAGDGARTIRFGHRRARVALGLGGTYWRTRAAHTFSAWTTNTSHAELHAVPRSLDLALRALGGAALPIPDKGLPLDQRGVDESAPTSIRLDELLPGAHGAVDLVATFTPRGSTRREVDSRQVQLTDLAITAAVGHGSAAVVVTDLDDAKAAPGALVELYRMHEKRPPQRLGQETTGPHGEALLRFDYELDKDDRLAVVAHRGADWTFRTIDTPSRPDLIGTIFTERGIYRPGETVKLSGVLRAPRSEGLALPGSKPVRVKVSGGDTPLLEQDVTLSAFGTFSIDVPIPKQAPVGSYRVEVEAGRRPVVGRFHVAEYRPTEIEVTATTDHAERLRGEPLQCEVRGRYLHGGPMAGAAANVVVTRRQGWVDVPGLGDFSVRDHVDQAGRGEILRARRKLDARGAASFAIPLALPDQTGPELVHCSAEAVDLNRRTLAADAETLVHPGELYVAIGRPPPRARPGETVRFVFLSVTRAGERREARVHVEATRREGRNPRAETGVGTCDVATGGAPVTCAFTVPANSKAGSELVVRATVKDAKGNVARASRTVDVEIPPRPRRPEPPPPPVRPSPSPPQTYLRAHVERKQAAGKMGSVLIESPFAGAATAVVTIEREGVLWQNVVPLPSGRTSVDFPVTDAMIPEAYVAVNAISAERSMRTMESFEVDPASKLLAVDLDIGGGAAHRPGEAVDVNVRVKDAAGRPVRAEITLWSADEATLSLVRYRVPDLHGRLFFDWRPHHVTSADSRHDLVRVGLWGSHRTKPPQVRMGATMVSPERGDFRQTAFFEAHLVTDDAGRLTKRFTLPDGLTTYRVLATAVTADDRFGSHETKLVTSLPLMARATLPRVVRAGDRFEASVVVSADAEGDAVVTAEAAGLVLGAGSRTVHLDRDVPAEVRFPLQADRAGTARFSVRATKGSLSDAMTLTREVVTPLVPESSSVDGQTDGAAAEALGDLSAIRPDYGGLEVSLSTSPISGLAGGVEQLVEYPYGCTEQTVSRLVPLLALRDLATALGASLPAKTDGAVRDAVARLLTHQRKDGGFGLWRESARSDPWLTAWAMWGLGEARRRGAAVPQAVETRAAEARARAYLEKAVAAQPDDAPEQLAVAAFVADLAALDGKPDAALASKLFAQRERLPPFSRALLLHALALGKDDPDRVRELARGLEDLVRLDGGAARVVVASAVDHYDTDTRATAMLLRGLFAADPKHPLVPRLAQGLIQARRNGRFRTTHDAAWALLALDDLRRAAPPPAEETDVRVFLGDALLRDVTLRGVAPLGFGVPAASLLGGGVRPLAFTTSGPLHYHARLRFARRELPAAPVEAGMFLTRSVRPLEAPDPPLPDGTFAAGALLAVELVLATPSPRRAVVLESPLPAGLEAADADLRQGGSWLRALERDGAAVRRELRDDRVVYFVDDLPAGMTSYQFIARATTPGTFVAPPARAEEMYAPDTFARTGASTVTVLAR